MIKAIMTSYPLQVFRHRVYLPLVSMMGCLGDFNRGIVTQQVIELKDLGIDSSVGTRFETISYAHLRKNFMFAKSLGFDQFLDIGCGLGRSLVVANEVGFTELYGVDISENLISRCQQNLNKLGVTANLSCSDIADFEVPSGRLAIYLFNPFGYERMTELVSRLVGREKEILVIYHNPKHAECFKNQNKIHEHIWNHFGLYREQASFFLIDAKA